MTRAHDPAHVIRSLAKACDAHRVMPWCVEHASGGDPVPAAWRACTDQHVMRWLLRSAWLIPPDKVGALMWCDCATHRFGSAANCAWCVAVVRKLFPTVTLEMVVEAHRRIS